LVLPVPGRIMPDIGSGRDRLPGQGFVARGSSPGHAPHRSASTGDLWMDRHGQKPIGPRAGWHGPCFQCLTRSRRGVLEDVTILQAICEAVEVGKLQEPFTARDVAAALEGHHFSLGSLQASLARYSRRKPDPPLRQVARGRYRLANRETQWRGEPSDGGSWPQHPVPKPAGLESNQRKRGGG
jgi:hypothetical protein